jgi:hypothetical protein
MIFELEDCKMVPFGLRSRVRRATSNEKLQGNISDNSN